MDLRGKTVLLTGASTGLGPHIARRLRRAGAKFVLSARNEDALNKLAADLGDSRVIVADLSKTGEAERLAKEAREVDVLIANAGIPATGRLATFTVEEVDRALSVNLRSAVVLAHAWTAMIDGSGTIVTGGKLVDEKRTNEANLTGSSIQGGVSKKISKGDWVLVPEGVPHQIPNVEGAITLMSLHLPR